MGWKIKFLWMLLKRKMEILTFNGSQNLSFGSIINKKVRYIILTHVFTANSNGQTNKLQMPNAMNACTKEILNVLGRHSSPSGVVCS